jgi:hypothetical protein
MELKRFDLQLPVGTAQMLMLYPEHVKGTLTVQNRPIRPGEGVFRQ